MTIELAEFQAARQRIAPYVRRTPLLAARPLKSAVARDWQLYLKLEQLQISGSFKARGAVNKLLSLATTPAGLVTASGGNHGLGVAYAGWLKQLPTTIFLPHGTPADKVNKMAGWGAQVVMEGQFWDEANMAALEFAERHKLTYIHAFAEPVVIAGQGTIALEMLEDLPELDVLVVAVGGGGLISGVAEAARQIKPGIEVIGVEPVGAPTLYESLRAGKPVALAEITTRVGTLAPRKTEQINYDIISRQVSRIVLVSDEEMAEAQNWLWQELGLVSELSGVAALAGLLTGRIEPGQGQNVGVIICGSNTTVQF